MRKLWREPAESGEGTERDLALAAALGSLDPAASEPGYWMRFQSRVMSAAAPELARRRIMADLTVGDVLAGWARALVPAAALAAAAAAVVLMRAQERPGDLLATVTVEEMLVAGMGRETIPETLGQIENGAWVSFASDTF